MEFIRRKCGFLHGIDVAASGTRGGLSLGWKGDLNVTFKSFSKSHIDVEVEAEDEKRERGRLVDNNIRERLDRGVATEDWWNLFPGFKVTHLQHSFFNHCLIVVDTSGVDRSYGSIQQRFCFKADWVLNTGVKDRIQQAWNVDDKDVLDKLKNVGTSLSTWAK
ncbi:hypothetical protein J1N35_038278 [Gossypium stocksii]|uniref:Uncharacterized protein n=1 Tax=Gossypium stocksii TaxID=47602 RepID=A0A9D3ZMH3_9ROSI|nr:hypothetical protein J1N35_038278 [Gossypium stocksii]